VTDTIWILGASDPEMEAIESLLRECGQTVMHAAINGVRVHPGNAYRADTSDVPDGARLITVECGFAVTHSVNLAIDHHAPGHPGFGRPPAEFMPATSLGQVIRELANVSGSEYGPLGAWASPPRLAQAPEWGRICHAASVGWCVAVAGHASGKYGSGLYARWVVIPERTVLIAAADHCLGAAYRGECPGVNPTALVVFRAEERARFQRRPVAEVLADIESTTDALAGAPMPIVAAKCRACGGNGSRQSVLLSSAPWLSHRAECSIHRGSYEGVDVADMRRATPWPELPEAATRAGLGYISGPLTSPDGRSKFTVSGTAEQVGAWLDYWAPANGIVDTYGDPARGFAGGYASREYTET